MSDGQQTLMTRHVARLWLTEVAMPAGLRVAPGRFANACFQIVVSGGYSEPSARHALRTPYSVHFHPSEDPQDAVCHRSSRIFAVCMPPTWLDRLTGSASAPNEPCDLPDPAIARAMARIRREASLNDFASEIAIESLALELLAGLARTTPAWGEPPAWLRKAHDRILDTPAEPHSLTALAVDCSVDPAHLARSFRRHYHRSVGDHLRWARCRAALKLLDEKSYTLNQVAQRTGFCDSRHLKRTLRSLGLDPQS